MERMRLTYRDERGLPYIKPGVKIFFGVVLCVGITITATSLITLFVYNLRVETLNEVTLKMTGSK